VLAYDSTPRCVQCLAVVRGHESGFTFVLIGGTRTVYAHSVSRTRTPYEVKSVRGNLSPTATAISNTTPTTRLNRDRVIDAALRYVDEHGLDALSIRRLAVELRVGTMTVYQHVTSKADLLDGVGERVLRAIDLDAHGSAPWDDRLRAHARAFRATALAHPGAFALILTRQIASPEALRPTDVALEALRDAGLDESAAVHALRTFVSFQTGCILRELRASPTFSGRSPDGAAARRAVLLDSGFTNVADAADDLAVCDHEEEYRFGIELLIDGLRRTVGSP